MVPVFALVVAILAAATDPSSSADLILAALAVGAFAAWAYVPNVPLSAMSLAVLVPVVVAQRSGSLSRSCSRCPCWGSWSAAGPGR